MGGFTVIGVALLPDPFHLQAQEKKRLQRQARINQQLFAYAQPLQRQSPVGQYLVHRGLGKLSKSPQALRMAALPYFVAKPYTEFLLTRHLN